MNWTHIARSPRWRPLAALAERFHASALSEADGHTADEVDAAVTRLGRPLPVALVEWYRLVGRRLRSIQDRPVRLDELSITGDHVTVWHENQGSFCIDAPLDAGDDPEVRVADARVAARPRLSAMLTGMVLGETLVGAWSGGGEGGLGVLSPAVTGGWLDEGPALARLDAAFPPLPWAPNPFFDEPCRGDDALVLRTDGSHLEWMASSDEAVARLDAVVSLEPPGGVYLLHLVFRGLEAEASRFFTDSANERPESARLVAALGASGHLVMLRAGRERVVARVETRDPRAAWAAIEEALPRGALDCAEVAFAPEAMTRFTILHPAGLPHFVLP